jgi:hypothetical protein
MGLIDWYCSLKSAHLKEAQELIAYINAVMRNPPSVC